MATIEDSLGDPAYYEAHITVEPVFDERLTLMKAICSKHQFRVADLLMKKRAHDTATRSAFDTFCTGRSKSLPDLHDRMIFLVKDLKEASFKVWRYKLEAALLDVREEHA